MLSIFAVFFIGVIGLGMIVFSFFLTGSFIIEGITSVDFYLCNLALFLAGCGFVRTSQWVLERVVLKDF